MALLEYDASSGISACIQLFLDIKTLINNKSVAVVLQFENAVTSWWRTAAKLPFDLGLNPVLGLRFLDPIIFAFSEHPSCLYTW